jgi:drug/metabolite transporter (DMT)-like permease
MLAAQACFALMATSARLGGHGGAPWQEVCAARFVLGALTVYVSARLRGQSLRVTAIRAAWWRSAMGTLSAAGTFYLYATPHLALGDAATLLATAPIFVAILGIPILGEPLRRGAASALVCGFVGIALVAQPSFATAGRLVVLGTATAICAALSFIWLRRLGPGESSEAVVFHFAVVGSVVFVLLCIPVWQTPTLGEAAALTATGLCGGLGQIAMTRAYALDSAARVSILGYAGMVLTRGLALPFFGEIPGIAQAVGSTFVVASGALLAFSAVPAPVPGRAHAVPRSAEAPEL